MKAKVIKFSWEGKGTIPTVLMHWHNQKVKFEVPLAMMFAYQELEKEVEKLKDELEKANSQLRRSNLKIVTLSILLDK